MNVSRFSYNRSQRYQDEEAGSISQMDAYYVAPGRMGAVLDFLEVCCGRVLQDGEPAAHETSGFYLLLFPAGVDIDAGEEATLTRVGLLDEGGEDDYVEDQTDGDAAIGSDSTGGGASGADQGDMGGSDRVLLAQVQENGLGGGQ